VRQRRARAWRIRDSSEGFSRRALLDGNENARAARCLDSSAFALRAQGESAEKAVSVANRDEVALHFLILALAGVAFQ
jgi:hypothetical protein